MSAMQPIRPAATIIIVRQAVSNFEIFMLRRTSRASFASGMYVFPGGRVDGDDHLHIYDEYRTGPVAAQLPQRTAWVHSGAATGLLVFVRLSKKPVCCSHTKQMAACSSSMQQIVTDLRIIDTLCTLEK